MNLMKAKLVYDGQGEPRIPEEMGTPSEKQLQGTPREKTTEMAGRICYDSLGSKRSRDSEAYHAHIREVGHGSVNEHTPIVIGIFPRSLNSDFVLRFLINRRGVDVVYTTGGLRVTINFRAISEWSRWTFPGNCGGESDVKACAELGEILSYFGHKVAPMICPNADDFSAQDGNGEVRTSNFIARSLEPEHGHEKWISMYMSGSRGWSHEQVRHGDHTAISQRSTRYVDESGSKWVLHPLIEKYIAETDGMSVSGHPFREYLLNVQRDAGKVYDEIVATLQPWLTEKGTDKFNARKQSRGSARGFLGNALHTEMIFSASVSQWLWMCNQRGSFFADAEIRQVFAGVDDDSPCVIKAIRESQYASDFEHLTVAPSKDGIGQVIEGHHPLG